MTAVMLGRQIRDQFQVELMDSSTPACTLLVPLLFRCAAASLLLKCPRNKCDATKLFVCYCTTLLMFTPVLTRLFPGLDQRMFAARSACMILESSNRM